MKKLLFFLAATAALYSCKEEVESPRASFRYYVVREGVEVEYPQTVYAQEQVVFESTGAGDAFVVYTGAPGSEYAKRTLAPDVASADSNIVESQSKGYPLAKRNNKFSYSYLYTVHGKCDIAFIATSIGDAGTVIKTDVNTDVSINVVDSVGLLTEIMFTKPFSLMKAKTVLEGSAYNVMVPFGAKGFSKCTILFKAGKASVTRDGNVLVPFKNIFEDIIDLSSPVTYVVTAPSGAQYTYTVQIKEMSYVESVANVLNSLTIAGSKYLPSENKLEIVYPSNSETYPVTFDVSAKSTVTLDGVTVKEKYTVADLIASGNSLTITSESGIVSAPYIFTLKEDAMTFMPILFDGAMGFPLIKDDAAKTISFSLSSAFDVTKLQPKFSTSTFTKVSFMKDGAYAPYSQTSDLVDFTNPVKFRFVNGTDTLVYDLISK